MPTIEYTHFERRGPEQYPLGRNLERDSRSLAYTAPLVPIKSITWERLHPALDQLRVGACTGFAGVGVLLTEPYVSKLGLRNLSLEEATAWGFSFYSGATTQDPYVGNFPPNDDGSSGLGICRYLKRLSIIRAYRWGTTARAIGSMLQDGPVLLGMPWHEAFFYPDRSGFIDADPNWQRSDLAGGHEIEVKGIVVNDENFDDSVLECVNSWSPSWGDHGNFHMRLTTYQALRDQCDVKQFII